MAVFSKAFTERENLEKIVTLGDYLAIKQNLETQGMLRFVQEGGESGYSARELKDAAAAAKLTRWVDALSNERKWPIKRFTEQIAPMLAEGIAVAVAPSHNPFFTDPPIRALAQKLADSGERVDATGCLATSKTIRRKSATEHPVTELPPTRRPEPRRACRVWIAQPAETATPRQEILTAPPKPAKAPS